MRKYLFWFVLIMIVAALFSACSSSSYTGSSSATAVTGGASTTPPSSAQAPNWGVQTKTSGCQAHNSLQDAACTPGAILPNVTKSQVCASGYARSVRNVPQSVKNKAYAEYGIRQHRSGEYEVDHLVSLELGGSNDISNLWPEIATPKPGFHEKDKVENYLHSQVCKGAMTLKAAQIAIATNWLAVYQGMPQGAKSGPNTPSE